MSISSEMETKLLVPEYRASFVESQINMGLPFKIKALRKQRNWTQPQLAERAGMKQSRISAIEKPGGGKLNIDTLCRLAAAFDVALDVQFIPFGELMRRSDNFDPDSFTVKSFYDEIEEDARAGEAKTEQRSEINPQKTAALVPSQRVAIHNPDGRITVPFSDIFVKTANYDLTVAEASAANVYFDFGLSAQIGVAQPYEAIKRDVTPASVNWGVIEQGS